MSGTISTTRVSVIIQHCIHITVGSFILRNSFSHYKISRQSYSYEIVVVILIEGMMKNYKQDRTTAQILIMQIFKTCEYLCDIIYVNVYVLKSRIIM